MGTKKWYIIIGQAIEL